MNQNNNNEETGRLGLVTKASIAVACAVVAFAVGLSGAASATLSPNPADPTDGAMNEGANAVRAFATDIGIPAMVAVIIFFMLVSIGLSWLRKPKKEAKKV